MDPSTFEDVAFALIQKVSPRKMNKRDIPFDSLRELVSNEFLLKPQLHSHLFSPFSSQTSMNGTGNGYHQSNEADTGAPFGLFEEEDSRMSGCESSEDSHSRYSYEDESFRAGGRRFVQTSSSSSLSQQSPQTMSKSYKQITRAKRMQELRQVRRKTSATDCKTIFDCAEHNLHTVFATWYDTLLDAAEPPVKCYHMILNSLNHFFLKNTFGNNIENLVCEFLRDYVVRSCKELNDEYETSCRDGERRLLETELQVLMEMHLLYLDSKNTTINDVVKKLRFIYIAADASLMRTFLEEQVSDNFAHLIPRQVTELYNELCISVPADLEEYDSVWNKDEDLSFPLFNRTNGHAKQLEKLMEETQAIDIGDSLRDGKAMKEQKIENGFKDRERDDKEMDGSHSSARGGISSGGTKRKVDHISRRLRIISDTPEEKLKIKCDFEDQSMPKDIVRQTPMAKLRVCASKRGTKKRNELVKISEERKRPSRAAAIASEKASRAIIQANHIPASTSRETVLHRAKFNSAVTNKSKSQTQRNTVNLPEKVTHLRTSNEQDIFGKEQVMRFNQRMQDISKCKDQFDNDVFYGMVARRTGLFDEVEAGPVVKGSIQKNRTGRVVRASSASHLAHTLLNVHNTKPLEVWKLPKGVVSPQKLQRLVRPACKSSKKKLRRLRVQFRRASSPSGSQQPTIDVEH